MGGDYTGVLLEKYFIMFDSAGATKDIKDIMLWQWSYWWLSENLYEIKNNKDIFIRANLESMALKWEEITRLNFRLKTLGWLKHFIRENLESMAMIPGIFSM